MSLSTPSISTRSGKIARSRIVFLLVPPLILLLLLLPNKKLLLLELGIPLLLLAQVQYVALQLYRHNG